MSHTQHNLSLGIIVGNHESALLRDYKFTIDKRGYAFTVVYGCHVYLHEKIHGTTSRNDLVLHRNGNRLDNRRGNLFLASTDVVCEMRKKVKRW